MSQMTWIRPLFAVFVLFILSGCGREFDPYYRANKFRVLAVKSSEPLLEPGETAELTALTYAPGGGETTYSWEWCPFRTAARDEYECPLTREELVAQLTEGAGLPDDFELPLAEFDLGNEPTAQLPYPAPQVFIIEFCNALQQQLDDAPDEIAGLIPIVDCSRGFEITVRLIVENGDSRIVSGKRISLAVPGVQPNNNPDVTDIQIRAQEDEDPQVLRDAGIMWVPEDPEDWHTLSPDEPTELLSGYKFEVRSLVDPESVEIWQPPAPQGSDREFLDPESEVIVYRWFVSAGALIEGSDGLFVEGRNELEEAGDTVYRRTCVPDAPSNDCDDDGVTDDDDNCIAFANAAQLDDNDNGYGDACEHRIWSVVRDGRLGLDWVERDVIFIGGAP